MYMSVELLYVCPKNQSHYVFTMLFFPSSSSSPSSTLQEHLQPFAYRHSPDEYQFATVLLLVTKFVYTIFPKNNISASSISYTNDHSLQPSDESRPQSGGLPPFYAMYPDWNRRLNDRFTFVHSTLNRAIPFIPNDSVKIR